MSNAQNERQQVDRPKLLVKVGKMAHLEELRKGKMFMKPLSFHRENEKKYPSSGVGDADEGLVLRATKDMDLQLFVDGVAIEEVTMVQAFANCSNPVFCCAEANYERLENHMLSVIFKDDYLSDFCLDDAQRLLVRFHQHLQESEHKIGLWLIA